VTFALLWRFRSPLALGLVLLFGVAMCRARDTSLRREGAMRERVAKLRADSAALQTRIDSTERHYHKTVAVVTRVSGEYEEQRREIAALATEAPLSLPAPVVKALAKADTLVRGCRTLIGDGSLLIAQKDTMQDNAQKRAVAQTKLSARSKYGLALKLAGAAAVGYGLHAVLHR
jgi:dsDNA-specific endonuclease/ATPase MutS2